MTLPLHVETRSDRAGLDTVVAVVVAVLLVGLLALVGAHPFWLVATATPSTVLVLVRTIRARRRIEPQAGLCLRISSDGIDVPDASGLSHLGWDELEALRVSRASGRTELRVERSNPGHDALAVDLTHASVTVVEIAASVKAASRGQLQLSLR